ncbi:MAG: TPM domain-containing protein [Solidesulfovibrio sp. DCME]|uniref:TPM domain-containing protein n=1 Tax=Solidesulfovibrio sp. DCME TaxID=3447380 RepID=UPI003D0B1224
MQRLARIFLSPGEQQALLAAVREAEAKTGAEIVPMVVGASDSYPKAELACALTVGLVAGVVLSLLGGTRGMWLFLVYFGLFTLAGFQAAKRLPALKRHFVSPGRAQHETLQAAQAAFYVHGLADTRERNALLVYISVFERLVLLLPDSGLARKLDRSVLDTAAAALSEGIRQGRQAEALTRVIAHLAEDLAKPFPPRQGDTNELKDIILL